MDSACTACRIKSRMTPACLLWSASRRDALLWQPFKFALLNRRLKTCDILSKLTRHQRFSTHDLPSLFADCRNFSGRISGLDRFARIFETGFGQCSAALSALLHDWTDPAYDLSRVDVLAARHHSDGRILLVPASTPDRAADWLRTDAAFRRRISRSPRAWNSLFARRGATARCGFSAVRNQPVTGDSICLHLDHLG